VARTPDPKLHAVWRERINRQAQSGLTIAEFCVQDGVATSNFHAWKRRFRLMDSPGQCSRLPTPSAFLPVTVRVVEHGHDESLPIEADLPNGIRLRIPTTNQRLAFHFVRVVARARTDSGGSR
jgi:hypothetical protein